MPSLVAGVNARWVNYSPSDAAQVQILQSGTESQLRWGVQIDLFPHGLGVSSSAITAVQVGASMDIARFRHFNYEFSGQGVTSATAEIRFEFANGDRVNLTVELSLETVADGSVIIRLAGGTPLTISHGSSNLRLTGFRQGSTTTETWTSTPGGTREAYLVGDFGSTPMEEANCVEGEFLPVFDPKNCEVPVLCPISDEPIIQNCDIPVPPASIVDCPDIDIPVGIGTPPLPPIPPEAGPGSIGPPGPAGPAGPAGPPGSSGCSPRITSSAVVFYVENCSDQRVLIVPIHYGTCSVHILIIYYLCKPYHYGDDCCVYQCCDGEWSLFSGDAHCFLHGSTTPAPDPEEPDAPEPIFGPENAPCLANGFIVTVCPCAPPTTTTTCYPCYVGVCGQVQDPARVTVSIDGTCDELCKFEERATRIDDCWTSNGKGEECDADYVQLCCTAGDWAITITCNGTPYTLGAEVTAAEDACTFSAQFPGETLEACCDEYANVIVTFVLHRCSNPTTTTTTTSTTTTTAAPPACLECSVDECGNMSSTGATVTVEGEDCPELCNLDGPAWRLGDCYLRMAESDAGCSAGEDYVRLCCESGTWRITLACNGSVASRDVTMILTAPDHCIFTALFSGAEFGACCNPDAVLGVTFTVLKC